MAAVTSPQLRAFESSLVRAGMMFSGDAAGLVEGMVEAQYSGEQMAMIGQQVQAAAGDRSTREAVVSKIREGMAKRVGPEGIVKATDRVRQRYGFAMETAKALTKEQYASLGGIIADSLSSGLSQPDAKQITNGLQTRSEQMGKDILQAPAAETILTARDMVRLGVSSQVASAVVGEALARGYDAAATEALRQTFNTQMDAEQYGSGCPEIWLGHSPRCERERFGRSCRGWRERRRRKWCGGKGSGGSGAGGGAGSGSGGSGSGGGGKGGGSGSAAGGKGADESEDAVYAQGKV